MTFDTRATDDRSVADDAGNTHGGNNYITEWRIGPVLDDTDTAEVDEGLEARQFKTLWFDDDLDGDLKVKGTDKDPTAFALKGANDLYGPARGDTPEGDGGPGDGQRQPDLAGVIDEDNDPTSDFGKIDLVSAKDDPTTADNETRVFSRRVTRAWTGERPPRRMLLGNG